VTEDGEKLCNKELYNLHPKQSERNYWICSMHAWARDKNFLKVFYGKTWPWRCLEEYSVVGTV